LLGTLADHQERRHALQRAPPDAANAQQIGSATETSEPLAQLDDRPSSLGSHAGQALQLTCVSRVEIDERRRRDGGRRARGRLAQAR